MNSGTLATAWALLTGLVAAGCADRRAPPAMAQVEVDIGVAMQESLLLAWYPRVVDSVAGGFLTDLDSQWQPIGRQDKYLVGQARHTWSLALAAEVTADTSYLGMARSGLRFIEDRMWDDANGGFVSVVTREGLPNLDGSFARKSTYGNAFAVYAASRLFEASGDSSALYVAQRGFRWLDEHAHDSLHGGYFQLMQSDGAPLTADDRPVPPKNLDSSLHVLEALTELRLVWPDSLVQARLEELLVLMLDVMIVDRRTLGTSFSSDWTRHSSGAVSGLSPLDPVSFGHDLEAATLMVAAARALGIPTEPFWSAGKTLVDHALRYAWDAKAGGFFDAGRYDPRLRTTHASRRSKIWWVQAEALNALHMFARRYPGDPMRYDQRFREQWAYIRHNLIDEEEGGWYQAGIDTDPDARSAPKAHRWKTSYHTVRSLTQVLARLSETGPVVR